MYYSRLTLYSHDSRCIFTTHAVFSRLTPYSHDSRCIFTTHAVFSRLTPYFHDSRYILTPHAVFSRLPLYSHDSRYITHDSQHILSFRFLPLISSKAWNNMRLTVIRRTNQWPTFYIIESQLIANLF